MKALTLLSCIALAMANDGTHVPHEPRQATTCAEMPSFMGGDRIVGGAVAPSMIPWQVAMLSGNFQFCGGTVLDECTVLSAAHCGITTSHSIRAGSLIKTSGGQVRGISQVINNNDLPYNGNTLNNDWVILKLDSNLSLGGDVQAACLPSDSNYLGLSETEEQCWTSGWGTLSSGGSSPNDLRYVQVPAITNAQCNQAYNGDITSSMICAGYPGTGGKDACQGDSGGPFVCSQGGKAIIAGVVSWGYGCAAADFPGVYARNTAALSWIQANMGGCGNTPSPPPPSPTPSPSPSPSPSACGSPQWKGDGYCDDENNNAGCNWDGGDCCGDDVNTTFCTDCQCLDPDFGGAECKDIWKTKKCIKRKNKGKCGKKKVKKNCQKTCEYCTAAGRIEDLFDEDDLFDEEFDEDLE